MRSLLALVLIGTVSLFGACAALAQDQGSGGIKPCRAGDLTSLFVLRSDFTDLPVLGCANQQGEPLATAVGANAYYGYDDIHHASSFGVNGLAALDFRYMPSDTSIIRNISFGPFVQGAEMRTLATATTPTTTSGSVTGGGYVQFVVEQPLRSFIRLRGGELTDRTSVRDGTAVSELIPAFALSSILPSFISLPDDILLGGSQQDHLTRLHFIFAPELEAQYDSLQGGPLTYHLFASRREALRLGPLVTLKVYGFDIYVPDTSPLKTLLTRTALSLMYHADWDVLSERRYYSFQPAVIFNLDAPGHYAVTTSYAIGDSEASGNRMRQVKVAFAAKF